MSDPTPRNTNSVENALSELVTQYGVPLVAEALLEFASGADLKSIAEKVVHRAIRMSADAEASAVL